MKRIACSVFASLLLLSACGSEPTTTPAPAPAKPAATPAPAGTDSSYSAPVQAHPAPNAQPGHRWHTGMHHLVTLQPTAVK